MNFASWLLYNHSADIMVTGRKHVLVLRKFIPKN